MFVSWMRVVESGAAKGVCCLERSRRQRAYRVGGFASRVVDGVVGGPRGTCAKSAAPALDMRVKGGG